MPSIGIDSTSSAAVTTSNIASASRAAIGEIPANRVAPAAIRPSSASRQFCLDCANQMPIVERAVTLRISGHSTAGASMKLFRCDHCSNVCYFENTICENCGHTLGYWHATNMLVSLEPEDDHFHAPALPDQKFVYCANAQYGACNW